MNKKITNIITPKLLLITIFILILAFEIYILYVGVYNNLSNDVIQPPTANNIVRLDLATYAKTLNLLDESKNFSPPIWNLSNPNPFQ